MAGRPRSGLPAVLERVRCLYCIADGGGYGGVGCGVNSGVSARIPMRGPVRSLVSASENRIGLIALFESLLKYVRLPACVWPDPSRVHCLDSFKGEPVRPGMKNLAAWQATE